MSLRSLLLVPVVVLALAGCSDAQDAVDSARDTVNDVGDTAGKVRDCAGLVRDVAGSGLSRVPTQAEAQAAKDKLDERVGQIGDQTVKDAAGDLADRLGELTDALRSTDTADVQEKVTAARDAAREAAGACNIPVGQLLG